MRASHLKTLYFALGGLIVGSIVPTFVVYLDLYQLESDISWKNILWVISSQNAIIYSFLFFPITVAVLSVTFRLLIKRNEDLKIATAEVLKERARAEANGRFVAVAQMASGVAHEINNPLAIVKGFLDVTLMDIKKKKFSELESYIEKCSEAVIRTTTIVRELERSVDIGGSSVHVTKIDLRKLLRRVIEKAKMKNGDENISIDLSCPLNLYVKANEMDLEQAIMNIVFNAIDAVSGCEDKWIKIIVNSSSDYCSDINCTISIIDSGGGINESVQDKIFEPFYTSKSARKGITSGLGLGLSTSRALIEKSNGTICLSKESSDTEFVITLTQ